jgi:hypothetical protein
MSGRSGGSPVPAAAPVRRSPRRPTSCCPGCRARSQVSYSRPHSGDRHGPDLDAIGGIDLDCILGAGVPRDADFYLCGPSAFLRDLTAALLGWASIPDAPPTSRVTRRGARGRVRPLGAHDPLGSAVRQPARARRSTRRPRRLVVSHRRLPPLRVRTHRRRGRLRARAPRRPRPGQALLCCARPQGPVTIDL